LNISDSEFLDFWLFIDFEAFKFFKIFQNCSIRPTLQAWTRKRTSQKMPFSPLLDPTRPKFFKKPAESPSTLALPRVGGGGGGGRTIEREPYGGSV